MLVTYDMNYIAVFVCKIIIFANSMIIVQVAFSLAIMPLIVVYHKQYVIECDTAT